MKRKASRKPASKKRSPVAKRRAAGPLVLRAECVIESADALRRELLARLGKRSGISIDASKVQRIDTASFQVLAAFVRDCQSAGRTLEWVGVPASFADTARMLDLSALLGLAAATDEAVPA